MHRCFIGFDHRQPISANVAWFSLVSRASEPVAVSPIVLSTLPLSQDRVGLTPFTFSRYMVPWLCDYQGWALFMDADVVVLGDVAEVFKLADDSKAVLVSKNPRTFEWPSVVLWNCGHEANQQLTPEYVNDVESPLFKWGWLGGANSDSIGELPREWNHLVGYDNPRDDAKLVHFTAGIPAFPETQDSEYANAWHQEHKHMNGAIPWVQLMGNSVHAAHLPDGRILPHFHKDVLAYHEQAKETAK